MDEILGSTVDRLWIDPYNENNRFKTFQNQFSTKKEALKLAHDTRYEQAMVVDLDLPKHKQVIFTRGFE